MRLALLVGSAAAFVAMARGQDNNDAGNKAFVTPVAFPAPQTSVTSTAFNPNIQNAGGTTNAAGTFDVVSLARSSSHAFDSALAQTTSFVITPASYAAGAGVSTPAYYSDSINTAVPKLANQQDSATKSSVSLNTAASVMAQSTAAGDGAAWSYGPVPQGLGLALGLVAAAALGGAAVL